MKYYFMLYNGVFITLNGKNPKEVLIQHEWHGKPRKIRVPRERFASRQCTTAYEYFLCMCCGWLNWRNSLEGDPLEWTYGIEVSVGPSE